VRLLGEPLVANLEKVAEVFKVLITEGPAGLWRLLLEKLEALKERVLGQIMQMLTVEVIKAGVIWLIGLLNPASAFIKACKAIYDIVMFFVERGRQIIELVNAILDSMAAIAAGNLAKMAAGVEGALAKMVPVVIGFLASLLGLGNISEKVKEIIEKIQEPVNQAIDWLIGKAASLVKSLGDIVGITKTDGRPEDRLRAARESAVAVVNRYAGKRIGAIVLRPMLAAIKLRYGLSMLDVVPRNGRWTVVGAINPNFEEATEAFTPEQAVPEEGSGKTLLVGEGNFSFSLSIAEKTPKWEVGS
jgi:hypothetical protein